MFSTICSQINFSNLKAKYPDILLHSLNLGMIKYKLKKHKDAELLFETVIKADSNMVYVIEAFKDENE